MEKGRISDSRKKSKKQKKLEGKVVLCQRCGTKTKLVKVIGTHELYKCPKCNRTTERWN